MTTDTWMTWVAEQLADLSVKLMRQGFDPERMNQLMNSNSAFREQYQIFETRLDEITQEMMQNPDGYHHFGTMTDAKMDLLRFTNLNREAFLQPQLAQIA